MMEDISPDGDQTVLKLLKTPGPNPDDKPWKGDVVWIHYTGTLENGTVVDSSYERGEKLSFPLGRAEFVRGLDIGILTMALGEISVFKLSGIYGYGDQSRPAKVPINATVIFEVELLQFGGEDISKRKDNGIIKRTKIGGDGLDTPNDGGTVTIDFVGSYNGHPFDIQKAVHFVLGEGTEIKIPRGVEFALEKMKRNETAVVKLASKYAFGAAGFPEKGLPPNANVVYEVELLSFERAKESWQIDAEEKVQHAYIFKQKGTEFFVQGKYELAANNYFKIIDYLEHELMLLGPIEDERKALLLAGRLNMAMCHLKLEEWIEARNICSRVLEETENIKGYFRRGEAYYHLREFENAIKDFEKVLLLDPTNKAAMNKKALCTMEIREQRKREKHVFANMFDKFAKTDKKREEIEKVPQPLPNE